MNDAASLKGAVRRLVHIVGWWLRIDGVEMWKHIVQSDGCAAQRLVVRQQRLMSLTFVRLLRATNHICDCYPLMVEDIAASLDSQM